MIELIAILFLIALIIIGLIGLIIIFIWIFMMLWTWNIEKRITKGVQQWKKKLKK